MSKGGSFEGEICKKLSLWFTEGKTELAFWRSAGSGGRMTNRRRGQKETKEDDFGDIKADMPEGEPLTNVFSIELKTGYAKKSKSKAKKHEGKTVVKVNNWAIMDSLDSRSEKSQFIIFWEQAERDAKISNRKPMLIFRRQNKMPCIAMYADMWWTIKEEYELPKMNYINIFLVGFKPIIIMNLQDFFLWTEKGFSDFIKTVTKNKKLKLKTR